MNFPGEGDRSLKAAMKLYDSAKTLLRDIGTVESLSFLETLPNKDSLEMRHQPASSHPAVSALADIRPTSPISSSFVKLVRSYCDEMAWRQPYSPADFGRDFVDQTAWFPIADRDGPLVMTSALVEVFLMSGGSRYPSHSHTPEELYILLGGACALAS